MAGRQNKKKPKGKRPSEPAPCAVLWGLSPSSGKGAEICAILDDMGVITRVATPQRLNDPAGAFARHPGFRPSPLPYSGPVPECEFLLLCGLSSEQLDAFLSRSREEGCTVAAKAVLNKSNRSWPLIRVIRAVSAESRANPPT